MQQPVRQYSPAGHGDDGLQLVSPLEHELGPASHSGGTLVFPRQKSHVPHGLPQSVRGVQVGHWVGSFNPSVVHESTSFTVWTAPFES
jgi:hypothetical protein